MKVEDLEQIILETTKTTNPKRVEEGISIICKEAQHTYPCELILRKGLFNLVENGDKTQKENFLRCVEIILEAILYFMKSYNVTKLMYVLNKGLFELLDEKWGLVTIEDIISYEGNVLFLVLRYYNYEKTKIVDYQKCYDILISKLKEKGEDFYRQYINTPDDELYTTLHFVAYYCGAEKVLDILNSGASLALRSKYGFMPIQNLNPEVFQLHLDDCVECKTNNHESNIPFELSFHTFISPEAFCQKDHSKNVTTSMDAFLYLADLDLIRTNLKHPVLETYINMKWKKIRTICFVNLAIYFIAFCSFGFYMLDEYPDFSNRISFSKAIFVLMILVLIFEEIIQLLIIPKDYLKLYWGEFLVNISVILFAIAKCFSITNNKSISALMIILLSYKLVLMFDKNPFDSIQIQIMKRVNLNFFKLILIYSPIIFAFSISFLLLLRTDKQFENKYMAVFKTLTLISGDVGTPEDFGNFPITGRITFLIFILLIGVVLLNLINSLAVDDTKKICDDPECVILVAKVKFIYYIEKFICIAFFHLKYFPKLKNLMLKIFTWHKNKIVVELPINTIPFEKMNEVVKRKKTRNLETEDDKLKKVEHEVAFLKEDNREIKRYLQELLDEIRKKS